MFFFFSPSQVRTFSSGLDSLLQGELDDIAQNMGPTLSFPNEYIYFNNYSNYNFIFMKKLVDKL